MNGIEYVLRGKKDLPRGPFVLAMEIQKTPKEFLCLCIASVESIDDASTSIDATQDGKLAELAREISEEFSDYIRDELPYGLPPKWNVQHKLELIPKTKPLNRPPYRLSFTEDAEIRRQLEEYLKLE